MAVGAFTLSQLLIIAVIVVLLFGTRKLGNIGEDLGKAIKGFKKAMGDKEEETPPSNPAANASTPPAIPQDNRPPIDSTAQVKKEEVK
jgi:sec-independent protein translocase protein TatA